eukprot:gene7461-7671_t
MQTGIELAKQIHQVAAPFVSAAPGLSSLLLVGGTDPSQDVAAFKASGGHILIGTPGRLNDVMKRLGPAMDTKTLEVLVLDEADRLLDMGFKVQLDAIMARLPKQRRTGLFSATQTVAFLDQHRSEKVIVYCLTCACVEFFALILRRLPALKGLRVAALHGQLKQAARELTLTQFSEGAGGVLLCTDIAARGLDIPDVAWIVQYDPPQDPAAFVHRVGRTARMGRSGSALALLLPNESSYVDFLRLRKVPLVQAEGLTGAPDAVELSRFLRAAAEGDREVMEKGTRAFVSLVRGYKEHHCKFVFRIQELAVGPLAQSWGLMKLPRMPELKKGSSANDLESFTPSEVEPDSVKFKEKAREKQRQQARLGWRAAVGAFKLPLVAFLATAT